MKRFFDLTFRPFFVLTGIGTAGAFIYAFWPEWALPQIAKIAHREMRRRIFRSCRGRHDRSEPCEIHLVGRGVAKRLMNAPTIVKIEVLGQPSS